MKWEVIEVISQGLKICSLSGAAKTTLFVQSRADREVVRNGYGYGYGYGYGLRP